MNVERKINDNIKETKVLQVVITLFYGQFLSNSIFDNFIRTIPDMFEDPTDDRIRDPKYQLIIKIVFGSFIFIISVLSLIAVWKRYFKLILISGVFLFVFFMTTLLMATVQLTLQFETMNAVERFKLIAKLAVEAVFQLIGIGATFQINLLAQLEKQNKKINDLFRKVQVLQDNFDNILSILEKNIDFDPNVLAQIEMNIQSAKSGKTRIFGHKSRSQSPDYENSIKKLNDQNDF